MIQIHYSKEILVGENLFFWLGSLDFHGTVLFLSVSICGGYGWGTSPCDMSQLKLPFTCFSCTLMSELVNAQQSTSTHCHTQVQIKGYGIHHATHPEVQNQNSHGKSTMLIVFTGILGISYGYVSLPEGKLIWCILKLSSSNPRKLEQLNPAAHGHASGPHIAGKPIAATMDRHQMLFGPLVAAEIKRIGDRSIPRRFKVTNRALNLRMVSFFSWSCLVHWACQKTNQISIKCNSVWSLGESSWEPNEGWTIVSFLHQGLT